MKKLLNTIFIASLILGLSSCEDDIVLDIAEQTSAVVVIEGTLTNDTTQQQFIRVSNSASYYSAGNVEPASGAIVKVNGLQFQESTEQPGYYFAPSTFELIEGTDYTLTVELNGETYSATSTMNPSLDIDFIVPFPNPIQFIFNPEPELGDTLYTVGVYSSQSEHSAPWYLMNLYLNDSLISDNPRDKFLIESFNFPYQFTGSNQPFYTMNFDSREVQPGRNVTLEVIAVSDEFAKFYDAFVNQTDLSGNPFASTPPANVPSNLSNGAYGFFQVGASKKYTEVFQPL